MTQELTEDTIRRLYETERLTDSQIGVLVGCSCSRINILRHLWGIPTLYRPPKVKPLVAVKVTEPLSTRLLEIFLGSMLGDGCLMRCGHSAEFTEAHCDAQKAYLEWKKTEFGALSSAKLGYITAEACRRSLDKYTGRPGHSRAQAQWSMNTKVHPEFSTWERLFYSPPKGKQRHKWFPPDVIPYASPLMLAVWFGDDGCSGQQWPTIACHSKNHSVALAVLKRLGFDATPNGENLEVRGHEQARRFAAMVQPLLHDCLAYKLDYDCRRTDPCLMHELVSDDAFKAAVAKNLTVSDLAFELGVGRPVVHALLKASGLTAAKLRPINRAQTLALEKEPRHGRTGRSRFLVPEERLRELILSGLSVRRIAAVLGTSDQTIVRELDRLGIPRPTGRKRGLKYTVDGQWLKERLAEGFSNRAIAKLAGVSASVIKNRAKALGV